MPTINPIAETTIGKVYSLAQWQSENSEFDNSTQTTLGGSMSSPFIESHIIRFKGWTIVIPKPYFNRRLNRTIEGTAKQVPMFIDTTTNEEVPVWISYFAKTAKAVKADYDRKGETLGEWEFDVLQYGGDLGKLVREKLTPGMTNKMLRETFEAIVKDKDYKVSRKSYPLARYDNSNHIIVDDADFAEFTEVAAK